MLYPFILTSLAGFATMIGIIPIFIKINNEEKIISASCAFASGVMICVSIFDLIPEAMRYLNNYFNIFSLLSIIFIFIMIGVIISLIMDNTISRHSNNNLFNVGLLSMLAIILHNIPEGIVTFIVSNRNIMLGISICLSIALHNIPEGISIAIPIYYATGSKFKAFLYTLLSSMSELFGAIITYLFFSNFINDMILGIILSLTSGIMIGISFSKLLPTGNSYDNRLSNIFFLVGFLFMIISLLVNNLVS